MSTSLQTFFTNKHVCWTGKVGACSYTVLMKADFASCTFYQLSDAVWLAAFAMKIYRNWLRPPKNICVFQVSQPNLGFCPDPKQFIVNCEQNVVICAGKLGKMYWKMQFLYKIFWQNKMLCRLTVSSFFRAETWNTHIFFFGLMFGPIAISDIWSP